MKSVEEIKNFSLIKNEPTWMTDLRVEAAAKFDELDLPIIERARYHRWNLFQGDFDKEEVTGNVPAFDTTDNHAQIVQVGTQTVLEQLPSELAEQGVIFTDMFTAMTEHAELFEQYFMKQAVKPFENKMTTQHVAELNSGVFLYVPKDVKVEEPIESLLFQDANSDVPFNKHVLIVADTHSEFTYLERFGMTGEGESKSSANIVVEVVTNTGAKVKFSAIDRLGENMTTFMTRRGYLGPDSEIDWAIGIMNDGNIVADFDSELVGNGSESEMKVVALSSGRQVQAVDTRVTNYGHHTKGNILQHGVILDRGTLTFNGIGHIIKGAKFADAQQETRVLMLSDKARADANPILLIDENEVTAGHAASLGRVDPEDMYYLMSRGIEKREAERLVIRGFLGSVITAIPVKSVQKEFVDMIEGKLMAQ